MRLFFAVELPARVRSALAALRFPGPEYRWVDPDLLHLTLVFLGEQPESLVSPLADAATRVAAAQAPLRLRLGSAGVFRSRGVARVLWVGVEGDLRGLRSAQRELADAIASLVPLADTSSFAPHLTLARRRTTAPVSPTRSSWPPPKPVEPLLIPVDSFHLVQSTLSRSGPHYTFLASFPLGQPSLP